MEVRTILESGTTVNRAVPAKPSARKGSKKETNKCHLNRHVALIYLYWCIRNFTTECLKHRVNRLLMSPKTVSFYYSHPRDKPQQSVASPELQPFTVHLLM